MLMNAVGMPTNKTSQFIISRKLSLRKLQPEMSKWEVITDLNGHCYICNHDIFSIIIWSPTLGKWNRELVKDREINEYYRRQLNELNRSHVHNEEGLPEICGHFTNWKP